MVGLCSGHNYNYSTKSLHLSDKTGFKKLSIIIIVYFSWTLFYRKNIKEKNKVVCLVPLGYAYDINIIDCIYCYFIRVKKLVIGCSPRASLLI